jgi:dTDP-4-amino-4,6-dideoxygalactose transaminase
MRHLLAQGIEVKIKHPLLMCDQPPYKERSVADIPHARETIGRILTLPLHEKMTDGDVEFVVAAILEFYGAN